MMRPDIPVCACPACGKRGRAISQKRYRGPYPPVHPQTVRPPKVWEAIGQRRRQQADPSNP